MFGEFKLLKKEREISKNTLRDILKNIGKTISIMDLMLATTILREEGKYVQKGYREEYLEIYVKFFIMRVKDINEDKTDYKDNIDKKELLESIELLKNQNQENDDRLNTKFPIIYTIISLYTTYILEEPIHPVGTPFPGNLKVTAEDNTYYCPVKENNKNNPSAVCKFCIAEQSKL
ncbi:DUF2115 domain-containing protein [Methanobrevibacter filiformis]|uniref:UPF0305 protein MBFIL_04120 n=1 Tax=Methanobrevibacter filiformis TaxID=55758 RepID=A0A166ET54_9EURY|nr:DUF2115 domain-containing protein [Methanobrevibacter filiformis]KZX16984.1 hypothetical protein MBFIL_04120 [Methanobrevibacter filiformis]